MLLALGAASSALDALQSLTSSKSTSPQTTGFTQSSTNPFDVVSSQTQTGSQPPVTGGAGFTQMSPATMSALIAAQGQASGDSTTSASTTSTPTDPSSALQDLFSQIDANGDGQISKTEFENALGAGGTNIAQADDVFNKLDANGDGSVSLDEMQKALQGAGGKGGHHHHHHVASSDNSSGSTDATGASASGSGTSGTSSDPLLQALAGATSTSVTNSDGSTTTSITNPDGTTITMTSPAATTSSSSATASYNFLEQMIQREAQAISSGATASLSMNV
jgi:Ca2+-binding EF-hand superfamily protein